MSERDDVGEPPEDEGVLEPADSLDDDDLRADVLDTGIDAGDRYTASTRFGTTSEEERRGESLDQLLAEEEPDARPDAPWTDEDQPSDDEGGRSRRAGRLVAPDAGSPSDEDATTFARDVGIDGGGAGAEEAAVHIIEE
jgi:hypothetical protein